MPEILHSVGQQRAREGYSQEPRPRTLCREHNDWHNKPRPPKSVSGQRDAGTWGWLATWWKVNVMRRDRL